MGTLTIHKSRRTDGLILRHWVKTNDDNDGDYYFAKFNKVINVTDYTVEEYEKYLNDPNWTKEETDYLFALCRNYDLRFVVIADRYEYPGVTRSMEDLKERYYGVNQTLLRERASSTSSDNNQDRQTLIQQFSFDKNKEIERKKALEILFNRTPEQIEEEEALFIEARRLEQNDMKLAKEREQLLKFLQTYDIQQTLPATPGPPSAGIPAQPGLATPGGIGIAGGSGTSPVHDKLKKKKSQPEVDTKKVRRMSNASVSSSVNEVEIIEKKEKLTPGVYVRSQKIPPIKPNMIQKVGKVMDELGIPIRPIMPTAQVCAKFEQLQTAIITLLDLKRQVDRQETDLKVKKTQKTKDGTPTPQGPQEGIANRKRSASNVGLNSRDKRKKA
ncbi:unnamed protein product [Umbelopsis ramanniana]